MLHLLVITSFAAEDAPIPDVPELPLAGWAVHAVGGPAAVSVGAVAAVGGSGGTQVGTLEMHVPVQKWQLGARLPFAAWRGSDRHDTGVGNLAFEAWRLYDKGALGFEISAHMSDNAWTWAYEAQEVWPSSGMAVVYQSSNRSGPLTIVGRGGFGLYSTPGFEPFPEVYARLSGAVVADVAFGDYFGLVGEGGLAWWDPSPLDLVLAARVDPTAGVRARAGFILPLTQWAGAGADQRISGLHEIGLTLDLAVGF